jgi:hypothetical protein
MSGELAFERALLDHPSSRTLLCLLDTLHRQEDALHEYIVEQGVEVTSAQSIIFSANDHISRAMRLTDPKLAMGRGIWFIRQQLELFRVLAQQGVPIQLALTRTALPPMSKPAP